MATTSNWESFLSPQESRAYGQFFTAANGGKSNVVTGPEAVQFFVRSGIPNEILSDIWETADRDNLGYLTPETFSIALKLIACAQHGQDVSQPILSTVVPIPQFEGINPDLAPMSPNVTGPVDTVAPAEREKYLTIFRAHQPIQGLLDGAKAREIFLKSKLPSDTLEHIWNLANVRKSGNLNQTEFVIAMHYIARMMDHTLPALPLQLPASVYGSAAGSISSSPVIRRTSIAPISRQATGSSTISHMAPLPPPSRINKVSTLSGTNSAAMAAGAAAFGSNNNSSWDVTPQQRQQYDAIFDRLDVHHTGLLPGGEAGKFFKNSRLPETELARVWDLADTEQRGQLTRQEFAVAMVLIQKRLAGEPLPNILSKPLATSQQQQQPTGIMGQSTIFQSPPSLTPQSVPAQPPVVQGPVGDLLGDFDNSEQLTETTNTVNQLQYQIKNENTARDQVKAQKQGVDQQLKQFQEQREQFHAQKTHLLELIEAENKRLSDLQSVVSNEQPEWNTARQEHDVAQRQLDELRDEITKAKATLDETKSETERLRRQVHVVQTERDSYIIQLNRLREYVKQQEKPALSFDEIFGTPTFEPPQLPQAPPASQQPHQEATSHSHDALDSEFDAIFGASFDEPKRQAPPPPPPHRRTTVRRQESPSSSVTVPSPSAPAPSDVTVTKKQRAPPPPPPSATSTATSAAAAVAIVGAASASAAIPQEAESENESESDTTTTDDSDDEIPLSVLKTEATKAESDDSVPLGSFKAADANLFGGGEVSNDGTDTSEATEDAHPDLHAQTGADIFIPQEVTSDTTSPAELTTFDTKPEEGQVSEAAAAEEPKADEVSPTTESIQLETPESDGNEDAALLASAAVAGATVVHEIKMEEEPQIEEIKREEPATPTTEEDDRDDLHIEEPRPEAVSIPVTTTEANTVEEPITDVPSPETEKTQQQSKEEDVQDEKPIEETTAYEPEAVVETTPVITELDTSNTETRINDVKSNAAVTAVIPKSDTANTEEQPTAEEVPQTIESTESSDMAPSEDVSEVQITEVESQDVPPPVEGSQVAEQEESKPFVKDSIKLEQPMEPIDSEEPDVKEVDASGDTGAVAIATVAAAATAATMYSNSSEDSAPEEPRVQDPIVEESETQEPPVEELKEQQANVEEPKTQEHAVEELKEQETNVEDPETQEPPAEERSVPDTRAASVVATSTNEEVELPETETQPQLIKGTTPDTSEDDECEFQSIADDELIAMNNNTQELPEQQQSAQPLAPTTLPPSQQESVESSESLPTSDKITLKADQTQEENESVPSSPQKTTNPFAAGAYDPSGEEVPETKKDAQEPQEEDTERLEPQSPIDDKEFQDDFDAVFMERPSDKIRTVSSSSEEGGTGENESFEMVSSNSSLEKPRRDDIDDDEFDAAFESELQDAKVVDNASEPQALSTDDFDAAFSSELMDAKIVSDSNNNVNPFSNNDKVEGADSSKGIPKMTWATSFGGFDFGQDEDDQKTSDEWDAIFGGAAVASTSTVAAKEEDGSAGFEGFQDSFDSSDFVQRQEQPQQLEPAVPQPSAPVPEPASAPASAPAREPEPEPEPEPVSATAAFIGSGSNLDQLVAMGFDRALAKDALNRYDQDLEKATNFLLDN